MDKYVCSQCFDDEFIEDFIKENAVSKKCSYCGNESNELISADILEVASFIEDGLRSEYKEAVECLPWESAEGGWQGTTYDTYDILTDEIGLESEELIPDLIHFLPETEWCDYHPYRLASDKELMFNWNRFSDQVKHRVRYVFFRLTTRQKDSQTFENAEEPYEVLFRIGGLVKEFGLYKIIAQGTSLFRARLDHSKRFSTVVDIGPPHNKRARYPNRFSPAGIPMFYGAFNEETAIAEVYDCPAKPKRIASVARFENLRTLRLLDFTNLPAFPSMFNGQTQDERGPLRFLHRFVMEATIPITKDGAEHIEYVPTQVVTEFFQHILVDDNGNHFDGLLYPSARYEGGVCSVIFCSGKDCTEDRRPLNSWFGSKQATLSLDTKATIYRSLPG